MQMFFLCAINSNILQFSTVFGVQMLCINNTVTAEKDFGVRMWGLTAKIFPTQFGSNCVLLAAIFLALLLVHYQRTLGPKTLSILRYKLCVLAEPEPTFGRYFSSPFIKKIQVFWQQRKTFHSIFTYCRCSPSLLNDGVSDLLVTCGLILHLLYSFVPC